MSTPAFWKRSIGGFERRVDRLDLPADVARYLRAAFVKPLACARDSSFDAHHLIAEPVDDDVGGLAHAVVRSREPPRTAPAWRLMSPMMRPPTEASAVSTAPDLVVDLHHQPLAGRVEALLRHLDGSVDEGDLPGHRGANFPAGLSEALVGRHQRAVDCRKLAIEVGDHPVAARAEPHVAGLDRRVDAVDLPRRRSCRLLRRAR